MKAFLTIFLCLVTATAQASTNWVWDGAKWFYAEPGVAAGYAYDAASAGFARSASYAAPPGITLASSMSSTSLITAEKVVAGMGKASALGTAIALAAAGAQWLFDCSGGQLGNCPLVPAGGTKQSDGSETTPYVSTFYTWGGSYPTQKTAQDACNFLCTSIYTGSNGGSCSSISGLTMTCSGGGHAVVGTTSGACPAGATLSGSTCTFPPSSDAQAQAQAAADLANWMRASTANQNATANLLNQIANNAATSHSYDQAVDPYFNPVSVDTGIPQTAKDSQGLPSPVVRLPSATSPTPGVTITPDPATVSRCPQGFYYNGTTCVDAAAPTGTTAPTTPTNVLNLPNDYARDASIQQLHTDLTAVATAPSDPTARTSSDLKTALGVSNFPILSAIQGWQLPAHSTTCDFGSFAYNQHTYTFQPVCDEFTQFKPQMSVAFLFLWTVLPFFMVLRS